MKRIIVIVMMLAVMAGAAIGADETKIATVSMQELVSAHPQGKANKEFLREEQEVLEAEKAAALKKLDALQNEARELSRDIENTALSQDARTGKKKEFQKKVIALQKLQRDSQKQLLSRQRELIGQEKRMRERLNGKIGVLVTEYAKENDIALVLDSSAISVTASHGVVYHEDSMDITKEILAMIKKSGGTSKKK